MIAGLVPDGYMVPFPTEDYVHQQFTVRLVDNSIYTGGVERDGQGWVKIPGNADVEIDAVNQPLRALRDAGTALERYDNGVSHVQVVQWPGAKAVSALAYVVDRSAGVRFSPQEGFYEGDVMRDGAIDHQTLHTPCLYSMSGPNQRTCLGGQTVPPRTEALAGPTRFVVRDWQVNLLAPRGQPGDCKSRTVDTGAVRFSRAADAALLANISPNPQAQVSATAVAEADGVAVRICNTGGTAAHWDGPTLVTLTQLP